MKQQFQRILTTPKATTATTLSKTQDLILSSFESIFPSEQRQDVDGGSLSLEYLHRIYEDVLGPEHFPASDGQIQVTIEQQIVLNYRLIEYFITLVRQNFVHKDIYRLLEEQTQKAEATIRSHIKVQQQLKMYLEYLESKIENMGKAIAGKVMASQGGGGGHGYGDTLRKQVSILQGKEAVLQRQKINLIKKNQRLQQQVQELSMYVEHSRQASRIETSLESSFSRGHLNLANRHRGNIGGSQIQKRPQTMLISDNDQEIIYSHNNNHNKISLLQQNWQHEQQYKIYLDVTNVKPRLNNYSQYQNSTEKDNKNDGHKTMNSQSKNNEHTQKKRSNYFPGKL